MLAKACFGRIKLPQGDIKFTYYRKQGFSPGLLHGFNLNCIGIAGLTVNLTTG